MNEQITTLQEAEAYAAAHGVALSPTERKRIAEVQTAELARLKALGIEAPRLSLADRWNRFYPKLLETILSLGETVLTFSQTLIVSLGVPLVLVLLLIVEHQRVVHGISLFETDAQLASFAAGALVLLNLVLEFQVHHIEHKAGYQENRRTRWSFRIWRNNAAYTLGLGKNWQERQLSPAQRYRSLLSLVTFSILALALAGSMRVVIDQTEGAWYEALGEIITQSDLSSAMTWLGGLLFAAAAVLSAQGLSRYVAIRCVEIVAAMNTRRTVQADPYAAALDQAAANVVMAIVTEKLARRGEKAVETHPTYPAMKPVTEVMTPTSSTNGNGKH